MKCINKKAFSKRLALFTAGLIMLAALSGCGQTAFALPYDTTCGVSSYQVVHTVNAQSASPFAQDLCIVTKDVTEDLGVDMTTAGAALLCDVNNAKVLYAQNVYETMHPASLTKIMTALIALKYGSMDQVLTASDNVRISESGAQLCGIKPGDTMTLSQALHILLIYSANDVGVLIAEGVAGDVDSFTELMNKEALAIGATNTHFSNPHGLTADNHYTTAYDLYLIFNEAIRYEAFREIIHMDSYSTVYYDQNGNSKEFSCNTTNLFLRGNYTPPENITVVGGKTGTTNAAGHCLILLSRDVNGAPYISVILRSDSRDNVYKQTAAMLSQIGK